MVHASTSNSTIFRQLPNFFGTIYIETGQLTLLLENTQNFNAWKTDNNGSIRLASKTDGVNVTWYYRASEKDSFSELLTTSFKQQFSVEAFDSNNKNMYVLTNIGRDKTTLVEYDPSARKEVKEIYSQNDYDLDKAVYDRKKMALVKVTWNAEKNESHFFDKEWEEIQQRLDKKFKGYETKIMNYNDARTKAIVLTENDRSPAKYHLYDFNTKESKEVANPFPWIKEKQMSHTKPIIYLTRDSFTIHGYLKDMDFITRLINMIFTTRWKNFLINI